MSLIIEKAKSDRSACNSCRRLIAKGSPRIRTTSFRASANICVNCLRSELAWFGISLVPLTERDFADIAAARMMGLKKDGLTPTERRKMIAFSTPLEMVAKRIK